MKKLCVVSSRSLFSAGLSAMLADKFEITDVEPDAVLVEAPGDVSKIREAHPGAKIIVLGNHINPEADVLRPLLECGVTAYLRPCVGLETLVRTIEVVLLGETVWSVDLLKIIGLPSKPVVREIAALRRLETHYSPHRNLSDRELTILHMLQQGASNKVIARESNIAEATVKVHVKAILRKLRVDNRTQAAMWAHRNLGGGASEQGME